jgi:hypothetical protein
MQAADASHSFIKSRWHSLAAVLLAASISGKCYSHDNSKITTRTGTPYAFGIFSQIFKVELGFSQIDLAIVGSSGSTGLYTGVLCGLSVENYGPKWTLRMGALLVMVGNLFIWLAVQKLVWHSVFVISVAYLIAQVRGCYTFVFQYSKYI